MSRKYFYHDASGVNADIARHAEAEASLRAKLADPNLSDIARAAYSDCLTALLNSKAQVVNNIGKKR